MSSNNEPVSVSYHDIFARNGFAKTIEGKFSLANPISSYFKRLSDNQILIIDVHTSHWEVQLCSLSIQKKDRLEAINHNRDDFKTIKEWNESTNRISLQNLKDLFRRLSIEDDLT